MAFHGRRFPIAPHLADPNWVLLYGTTGIQFDAASNSGYHTDPSYSWNHTCTGSDRYLIVGISMLSVLGSSVTSITYNGVALSLLRARSSVTGAVRVEVWGLVAPATGTHVIAVTLSTALDSVGGAVSFTGVHQSISTESANDNSGTNTGTGNDATVDITTVADNDMVIDTIAADDAAITVGAGQIERNNVAGALGTGAMSTEGLKTPPGAVTMNWTNMGTLATWTTVGIALRPLAAVSTLTPMTEFIQYPPPYRRVYHAVPY